MGAGVSDWRLARAVSRAGQMGVVSGTGLDAIYLRRLQDGDPGGHMRRALEAFPIAGIAERIVETYYVEGGKDPEERFQSSRDLAFALEAIQLSGVSTPVSPISEGRRARLRRATALAIAGLTLIAAGFLLASARRPLDLLRPVMCCIRRGLPRGRRLSW